MPNNENENTSENQNENEKSQDNNSQGGGENTEEEWDKDRALNTIRAQRESEKQLKTQNTELAKKLKAFEDREKSDTQRLQEELEEVRKQNQTFQEERRKEITRAAFEDAAQKAGAIRPSAVYRLADNIEVDDDGRPINALDIVKSLKKEYPELFSGTNGSADGGSGKGSTNTASANMNEVLRNFRRG